MTTTIWLADYLKPDWPGFSLAYRIERERRIGGEVKIEVSYGIASQTREACPAAAMLKQNRGHWGIENSLHYRRDVTLGEDACRIREGHSGQVMACLRNLMLFLVEVSNQKTLPAAIRHYIRHPQETIDMLTSPLRK